MSEPLRFYCTINNKVWNKHPVQPGPLACISPVTGQGRENRVAVPPEAHVLQDSGAYTDRLNRLSFEAAHERQVQHAERFGYTAQITHRASYDHLAMKVWDDETAAPCVTNTIDASRWLVDHRPQPAVLTVQGASPAQFTRCAEAIIPMLRPGDMLGFGGFAYTGKAPARLMPILRESAARVVLLAARAGVRHIHIWGVCYAQALGGLLHLCDDHGLQLSTDSAGPVIKITQGEWGYADWYSKIPSPPLEVRGQVVADHVRAVRN